MTNTNPFLDAPTMLGVVVHDEPLDPNAPPCTPPPVEPLTRPQAVATLMRLQKRVAFEGRGDEVEALSMAIHNIMRRHKQSARHTAKHYPLKGE
ncbi:MAG: hypothetical protein IJG70_05830 [Kiritimatiellae bacterium]|nr:hypothetical protein [Kiritimatiellia bacterium]